MQEAAVSVAAFMLFTAVGFGPAAALVQGERRVARAAALAPALGLGLLTLLSLPLCRYVGPATRWTTAATCILLLLGAGLAWRSLRGQADPGRWLRLPSTRWAVLGGLACLGVMQAPSLLRGLDFTAWRANPADAFVYISLAETLRVAPWAALIAGSDLNNPVGAAALAQISPTALLSARFVELPVALGNMGALAWVAEVCRHPVYRSYYPYQVAATATLFPLACLLGVELRLRLGVLLGMAGAITLGFWSRWTLETDAGFQICGAPLFLAAAYAWVRFEVEERPGFWSASQALLGLLLAATWAMYFPYLVTLAFGMAAYAVGRLLVDRDWRRLLAYAGPAGWCVAVLVLTAQADYYYGNMLFLVSRPGLERQYGPDVFRIFWADGLAGVWGLAPSILLERLPQGLRLPLAGALQVVAALLTVGLAAAGLRAREAAAGTAVRSVVWAAAGGLALVALCVVQDNYRTAGKAFLYCYPLAVAAAVWGLSQPLPRFAALSGAALAALPVWLVAQWAVGAYLSVVTVENKLYSRAAGRPFSLDLSPITRELDRVPGARLTVNAPRLPDWPFAFYVMLALAEYRPYYQSGLITDNSAVAPNFRLPQPPERPDYVVTLKQDDYLAAAGLGERLAETPELTLYRVTGGVPADFAARDVTIEKR
jgi:hypothetical protein